MSRFTQESCLRSRTTFLFSLCELNFQSFNSQEILFKPYHRESLILFSETFYTERARQIDRITRICNIIRIELWIDEHMQIRARVNMD